MKRIRLRDLQEMAPAPEVVALSGSVQGNKHIGAAVTANRKWVLDGATYIEDPCGAVNSEGCAIAVELKILRRILAVASRASPLTIVSTHEGVIAVLDGWMHHDRPELPEWYRLTGDVGESKLAITMRAVRDARTRLNLEHVARPPGNLALAQQISQLGLEALSSQDKPWLLARLLEQLNLRPQST